MNNEPINNRNHLRNLLSRLEHSQSSLDKFNSDSSKSLSYVERRNVIMPRICYFARVRGTPNRHRICLPYSDISQD